jgi:hypothetical protein
MGDEVDMVNFSQDSDAVGFRDVTVHRSAYLESRSWSSCAASHFVPRPRVGVVCGRWRRRSRWRRGAAGQRGWGRW